MKYRPKECLSCGGKKMQPGGIQLDLSSLTNFNESLIQGQNVPFIPPEPPPKPLNRIQEMIQKGLLETPRGYDSAMESYIAKTGDGDPQGKKRKKVDPFELYLKMQALQAGLSGIGNIMERGRQNQYMYDQFSSLGQTDPIPVSNAQPNPYNLYAKYGGNLKKYMQMGGYGRLKMKNVNIYNGMLPTPDPMAEIAQQFEESQLLNIYGGNRRRMLRDLRRGNSPIPVEMLSGENIGQQGYLQDGNFALNQLFKSGGWIKKVTDSIKRRGTEGKCTPITKPGCTGRAKALALTFKKIARNRKKD